MKKSLFRLAAYMLLCSPFFFFLTGAAGVGGGGGCSNLSSSQFTVTPSGENVSIDPSDPQGVNEGSTSSFTLAANEGFTLSNTVGGTCPAGTWVGTVYTTAAIVEDCTVIFSASENAFTLGGTVSGLSGTLVLQNNSGDDLSLSADGSFTFSTSVAEGSTYHVTVQTQPTIQTCLVSNGSGTMGGSDITNVSVNCEESIAYVTPLSPDASNPSQIQQFSLSQDGLLSFFENATQVEGHYGQMTFATVNGTQYAYILENGVTYCSMNSDGTFNNCTPTTAPIPGMNNPRGIAFATFNQQYAYLADANSASLFQCSLDTTSGDLSSCLEYFDGNIDAALGIAFNTDGNGTQHAYVSDAATGMQVCPMDANGSFMNPPGCATTPSLGAPPWFPYGITFTTAGGTRYAYVADNGAGANLGHVYRCLLNADGTFTNNGCVATPADTSSFAPWNPYSIAFKTLNGIQYAYVVNNQSVNIGSIYRCIVDESTGLFTQDCIETPDIPTDRDTWQPSGIAFR